MKVFLYLSMFLSLLPLVATSKEDYSYMIRCNESSDGSTDLLLKWSPKYVEKVQNITTKSIDTGEILKFDMNIKFIKSNRISINSRISHGRIVLSVVSHEGMFGPAYYTYEILKANSHISPVFEKFVGLNKYNEVSNAQTNFFKECEIHFK